MILRKPFLTGSAAFGCVVALAALQAAAQQVNVQADAGGEGIEVLTRGPVHEAFADPVSLDVTETEVIRTEPPAPIEEIPPEARPDDPTATWISGYWSWDPAMQDFLWVSGVWRSSPDGYRWVPGYWAEGDGGFQRVSGFWSPIETETVAYLPPPPETLEAGPNVPAPSDDHFWIPGCWLYQETRYQWRPGYWAAAQPDFIWVPAHYVYAPNGCIFVDGYWDVPLVERGLLFAPVYFSRPIYTQPDFYFAPSVFVDTTLVVNHFFAHPRQHCYYFGDYYGDRYAQLGYTPWFEFTRTRGWYDPIYTYASWRYGRNDRSWFNRLQHNHDYFVQHADARPAHTFVELRQQLNNSNVNIINNETSVFNTNVQNVALVNTVQNALEDDRGGRRLTRLQDDQRGEIRQRNQQLREFAQSRFQTEAGRDARQAQPGQRQLKLPEVARRGGRDGQRVDDRGAGRSPADDRPRDDRPGRDRSDRPDTQPGLAQPRTPESRPGEARPGRDQPGVDRPGLDRPGADQPGTERPGLERPRQTGDDLPGRDRPGVDGRETERRPGLDRPGGERPATQPGADVPDASLRRDVPGRDPSGPVIPGLDRTPADRSELDRGGRSPGATTPDARPGAGVNRPGSELPGRTPATRSDEAPGRSDLDRGAGRLPLDDRGPSQTLDRQRDLDRQRELDRQRDLNRQPGLDSRPGLGRLPGADRPGTPPGVNRDADRLPGRTTPTLPGSNADRNPNRASAVDRLPNRNLPGARPDAANPLPGRDRTGVGNATPREAFRQPVNPEAGRQPLPNLPGRDPRSASPGADPRSLDRGGLDRGAPGRGAADANRLPGASRPQAAPGRNDRGPGPSAAQRPSPQPGPAAVPRSQPGPQAQQPRPGPQPGPAAQPRPDRGPQPQPGPQPGRQGRAEAPPRGAAGPAPNPGRGAGGQGGRDRESKPDKKEK